MVILCYPAIRAICNYRIAHKLLELDVPLIPRIITDNGGRSDYDSGSVVYGEIFPDNGSRGTPCTSQSKTIRNKYNTHYREYRKI